MITPHYESAYASYDCWIWYAETMPNNETVHPKNEQWTKYFSRIMNKLKL